MSSPVKNPDNSSLYDHLNWIGQMVGKAVTISIEVVSKVATTAKNLLGDNKIPPGTCRTDLLYSSNRERVLDRARKLTLATRRWEAAQKKIPLSNIIETDEKKQSPHS